MEEKKVLNLEVDDVLPNRFQPRIRFNELAINELAESIKKHGVIQPIVVRPIGDKYEIIAGERRYKASLIAGQETIPAIVADLDDRNSAEVALIENVQREDLTPIEEAVSYKKILDMGYLTQTELAQKLGKEQSTIANKLRLLNLHEEVQDALLEEEISERHARSLLKLDKDKQVKLLKDIIEKRLTVRKTDEEIEKLLNETPSLEILDFESEGEKPVQEEKEIIEVSNEPMFGNPGFVDIDKIEAEAKDIFEEKPTANVDVLLNNDTEKEKEEENFVPRKFFSFLPSEDDNEEEKGSEDIFKDFNFNQPKDEKQEEIKEEIKEEIVAEQQPVEQKIEETPVASPFDFNFEQPKVEQPEETKEEIVAETSTISPFNFNFEEIKETVTEPTVEAQPEPVFDFEEFKLEEEPKEEIVSEIEEIEPIKEEVTTETPIIDTSSKTNLYEPYYGEDIVEEVSVEEPKIEVTTKNIKTAIDKVRECAKELETLGFIVDIDEFDLENMYQIILKVNKE
jgi:ParB family transcriptional regulator, chromosome partitioning protein